jgi:hypothetical protein
MVSHEEHRRIDRLLLGKEYPWVHRYLDRPARWAGKGHRRYRHDMQTVALVLLASKDPKAAISAFMHIAADQGERALRPKVKKS